MAGTPLLNLIRETLAGAGISEMKGILNGTTNFILTRMEGGMDYADALAKRRSWATPRRCPTPTCSDTTPWPRSPSSPTWSSAPP
jgi:homoserine dehydrogenase